MPLCCQALRFGVHEAICFFFFSTSDLSPPTIHYLTMINSNTAKSDQLCLSYGLQKLPSRMVLRLLMLRNVATGICVEYHLGTWF